MGRTLVRQVLAERKEKGFVGGGIKKGTYFFV